MLYNVITFINNILLTCSAVRLGVLHGEHKTSVSVGLSVGIFY